MRIKQSAFHKVWGYIVLILFFVSVFFYREIFFQYVIYCCDNLLITIPSKHFLIESLQRGQFPLWNPYIFSGTPFLADINLGVLYPGNALFFLPSSYRAVTISAALHITIAALGMFLLLKSYRASHLGAVFASVVFSFSGVLVRHTNNLSMLQVAVWLPWLVWSYEKFLQTKRRRFFLLFTGLGALQIIAGHSQLAYYTWIFLFSYSFFGEKGSFGRRTMPIVLGGLLVILLSSIQLIPTAELALHSTRLGRGFEYATFDSLHPFSFVRLLIPSVVGDLRSGTSWAQLGTVNGYIGILPFLLIFSAVWKKRLPRFFIAAAVVSFILALGKYTLIYSVLYGIFPGIAFFRMPSQWLFITSFALAVLSGLAVDQVVHGDCSAKFKRISLITSGVFLGIGLIVWAFRGSLYASMSIVQSAYPQRVFEKLLSFEPNVIERIAQDITVNLLVESIFVGTVAFFVIVRRTVSIRFILPVIVFGELFLYSRYNLLSVPESVVDRWVETGSGIGSVMKTLDLENYRVMVSPGLYNAPRKKVFGLANEHEESAWQMEIMRPDLGMIYGIPVPDGYGSMVVRSYHDYFGYKDSDPTGIFFSDVTDEILQKIALRFVIDTPSNAHLRENGFAERPVSQRLSVYENPKALPKVFGISEKGIDRRAAKILTTGVGSLTVEVTSSDDMRVVYSDTNYPGWLSTVDGIRAPIEDYHGFKSVPVSAGLHIVTFQYMPRSVQYGAILSFGGLISWCGLIVSAWKGKKL